MVEIKHKRYRVEYQTTLEVAAFGGSTWSSIDVMATDKAHAIRVARDKLEERCQSGTQWGGKPHWSSLRVAKKLKAGKKR